MKKISTQLTDFIYKLICPSTVPFELGTEKIIELINSPNPCLIARIGSGELQFLSYIKSPKFLFFIKNRTYKLISKNAGFFSLSDANNRKFYELYVSQFKNIDLLISWRFEEFFFRKELRKSIKMHKDNFDYFFSSQNPWTSALKGKRVLVVHPFAETIKKQYDEKREFLFKNPDVLPEFESLDVVKAVQTLAGNTTEFGTWFDALDYMEKEIDNKEYDIAILGCGAYGFPLAAHIKSKGKKAIYMGGVTQFLFGIKGKRYLDHPDYAAFINDYFVFPDQKDKPEKANIVEGGCYW